MLYLILKYNKNGGVDETYSSESASVLLRLLAEHYGV